MEVRFGAAKSFRSGLTFLEVLVSIGIVTLLLAMLVPAVMSARESARRASCQVNLHQFMVATEGFVSIRGWYPTYFAYDDDFQGEKRNHSVHVQLLPYFDQADLYNKITPDIADAIPPKSQANSEILKVSVASFKCPSDNVPSAGNSYRTTYGTTTGTHATWTTRSHIPITEVDVFEEGLWGGFLSIRSPAGVKDGLSYSVFFSERLVGDSNDNVYSPSTDVAHSGGHNYRPHDAVVNCTSYATGQRHTSVVGHSWFTQGYGHTAYNHVLPPNSEIPDCFDGWSRHLAQGAMSARSYHPGGVNVAMGDGSVRFVNEEINLRVWRSLGTTNGGDIVNEF